MIDGTLLVLLAVLAGLVWLAWLRGGSELVASGFGGGARLFVRYVLVIAVSFLAAGFAETLVPHEWVGQNLGADSGVRGLFFATGMGILTPAGPFVSMPIAAVMLRAGASVSVVVAFLTSWSLLAVHRFVAWEVPILGWRTALVRYASCLALPLVAGLLARLVSR